jgi:serine/threonine protein kinase
VTVVDPSAETAAHPLPAKPSGNAAKEQAQDETMEAPGGVVGTPSTAAAGKAGEVLEAGALLGKYRLERIVGAGGMGVVWAAVDPDLDRAVAIKVLRVAGDDPLLRSRLLREARAMARLKHGNVLTVYEVGTHKNRDYIAMELIDGASLDVWLAQKPPRPQIVAAMMAAGRGLAAAHAAGIVHRDFKPHNVLRDQDGRVLVTDFGLARGQIEDPDDAQLEQIDPASFAPPGSVVAGSESRPRRVLDSVLDSPLTQTGVLIGTPAYMAPEQFLGRTPEPRTDQFAYCVATWEALTGARPFRGGSLDELQQAAKRGVATVIADLPRDVRAVLQRGLDPDPEKRWPDMTALLAALERAFNPPSRRGLWVGILAAAGVAALIAGVVMIASSQSSSPGTAGPSARSETPRQMRIIAQDRTRDGQSDKTQIVVPLDELGRELRVPIAVPVPPVPPEPPAPPAAGELMQPPVPAMPDLAEMIGEVPGVSPEIADMIEQAMKQGLREELRAGALQARAEARAAVDEARAAADEWRGRRRCEPAERELDRAWSPQRGKRLMRSHPKNEALIGAVAILDGLRTEWLRAYARVCEHPEHPSFLERRACLFEMRDEIASSARELDTVARSGELASFDVASLATAAASTALCVGEGEADTGSK